MSPVSPTSTHACLSWAFSLQPVLLALSFRLSSLLPFLQLPCLLPFTACLSFSPLYLAPSLGSAGFLTINNNDWAVCCWQWELPDTIAVVLICCLASSPRVEIVKNGSIKCVLPITMARCIQKNPDSDVYEGGDDCWLLGVKRIGQTITVCFFFFFLQASDVRLWQPLVIKTIFERCQFSLLIYMNSESVETWCCMSIRR